MTELRRAGGHGRHRTFVRLVSALLTVACGGTRPAPPPEAKRETPADEILRIASVWQANRRDKGLRSEPSPISIFDVHTQSTITFSRDGTKAEEALTVEEHFDMRSGERFACAASARLELGLAWGRKSSEAAVELERPAVALPRRCTPAGFPDPVYEPTPGRARFVMRDDQLVGVAPPLEKRIYVPLE